MTMDFLCILIIWSNLARRYGWESLSAFMYYAGKAFGDIVTDNVLISFYKQSYALMEMNTHVRGD